MTDIIDFFRFMTPEDAQIAFIVTVCVVAAVYLAVCDVNQNRPGGPFKPA